MFEQNVEKLKIKLSCRNQCQLLELMYHNELYVQPQFHVLLLQASLNDVHGHLWMCQSLHYVVRNSCDVIVFVLYLPCFNRLCALMYKPICTAKHPLCVLRWVIGAVHTILGTYYIPALYILLYELYLNCLVFTDQCLSLLSPSTTDIKMYVFYPVRTDLY